ncbi:MoxR-like ATPase [Parafrankia irregularis]|uniref:MoxR-like ATPase n=1 Tax=Parafrankia irregularis TaxID=795642 RepID=A0A0S4QJH4_9ACTN|nr:MULTISPECIES: MoxR family ATPase [Parafrankia]MBE3201991.1 MoxR family ATPase [Parafrankia sp. CH37]CUU55765.1 MoxR-like ATPase [Parafrankia irregularis]
MNEWTTDPGVAASDVEARTPADPPAHDVATDAALLERALFEVKKVIVGQDHMVERMLVALLARGHCLLEGVPGVAKTLAVQTLATVVGGSFVRIQFTSDLVPSDIIGTRIFRGSRETFDIELGPVFANFVLADEINRAPAKVQSALLEVMSERQVSLGGVTHPLPLPFLVLATQNPIESEGVYPLPEAQRDRFLMKVTVPYPNAAEELEIVRRMGVRPPTAETVLDPDALVRLQNRADDVFVHHAITEYAVRLVLATRSPAEVNLPELGGHLAYGASPRASLGLVSAARALALLRGRDYVVPDDVAAVALDVLPHRLVLSYEALAEGLTAEEIARRILGALPPPQIAPRQQNAAEHGLHNGHRSPPPTHSGRWQTDPRTGFPEYFDGGPAR